MNSKQLQAELKAAGVQVIGTDHTGRVALTGERVRLPDGTSSPDHNPIAPALLALINSTVAAHVPAAPVVRVSLRQLCLALAMEASPGSGPVPQWAQDLIDAADAEGRAI